MADKTEKKTRTPKPRKYDNILAGASTLGLAEKVSLVKELRTQIDTEVKAAQETANAAGTLAAQLTGPVERG